MRACVHAPELALLSTLARNTLRTLSVGALATRLERRVARELCGVDLGTLRLGLLSSVRESESIGAVMAAMENLSKQLSQHPEVVKNVNAVFQARPLSGTFWGLACNGRRMQCIFTKGGTTTEWVLDLKTGAGMLPPHFTQWVCHDLINLHVCTLAGSIKTGNAIRADCTITV